MDPVGVLVTALWAMLPAYVPNNVAVLAGGGRPIDAGRSVGGTRLLGDGKTWRGTLAGTAAGLTLALVLNEAGPALGPILGHPVPAFPPVAAVTLPAGAMLGDVVASLLKRRSGRARGASAPGLDQLDFVVGALALTALAAPAWFGATFSVPVLVAVVLATPVLHLGTNAIAYALGLKDEPW